MFIFNKALSSNRKTPVLKIGNVGANPTSACFIYVYISSNLKYVIFP